ncbi:hypothetical protein NC651_019099 [Populus alba x Populus x berolinensis]|nr:hypothetical protein NC651_019099 [Populus alba x Populus x berolinensis]
MEDAWEYIALLKARSYPTDSEKQALAQQTGLSRTSGNYHSAGVVEAKNNRTDQSWPLPMSIPHHVNLEMISMMDSAPGTGPKQELKNDW